MIARYTVITDTMLNSMFKIMIDRMQMRKTKRGGERKGKRVPFEYVCRCMDNNEIKIDSKRTERNGRKRKEKKRKRQTNYIC